jgi:hypothetical protein
MSLTNLMGMPLEDIRKLRQDEGFSRFAVKTQARNFKIEKPSKFRIAVPLSIGVILGTSIAIYTQGGKS